MAHAACTHFSRNLSRDMFLEANKKLEPNDDPGYASNRALYFEVQMVAYEAAFEATCRAVQDCLDQDDDAVVYPAELEEAFEHALEAAEAHRDDPAIQEAIQKVAIVSESLAAQWPPRREQDQEGYQEGYQEEGSKQHSTVSPEQDRESVLQSQEELEDVSPEQLPPPRRGGEPPVLLFGAQPPQESRDSQNNSREARERSKIDALLREEKEIREAVKLRPQPRLMCLPRKMIEKRRVRQRLPPERALEDEIVATQQPAAARPVLQVPKKYCQLPWTGLREIANSWHR